MAASVYEKGIWLSYGGNQENSDLLGFDSQRFEGSGWILFQDMRVTMDVAASFNVVLPIWQLERIPEDRYLDNNETPKAKSCLTTWATVRFFRWASHREVM